MPWLSLLATLVDFGGTLVVLVTALGCLWAYLRAEGASAVLDPLRLRLAEGLVLALSCRPALLFGPRLEGAIRAPHKSPVNYIGSPVGERCDEISLAWAVETQSCGSSSKTCLLVLSEKW